MWYICASAFGHTYRINSKGLVTASKGKIIETFKLKQINNLDCLEISNLDYKDFLDLDKVKQNDYVFFDPPYLNCDTSSLYIHSWSIKDEQELLNICRKLNDKGVKFMITNTIRNKGIENQMLIDFIYELKLNVITINTLNNCFTNVNTDYLEVAIINYQQPFEQLVLF